MAKIWRKAIEQELDEKDMKDKSIAFWWKKFLTICSPLISDWVKKEVNWLRENIKKESTVLDIGCGWGRDLKSIAKIVKKGVGIDNDPEIIKTARRNLAKSKNIEVFCENAKKMHFDNNTFDYVFLFRKYFWKFWQRQI